MAEEYKTPERRREENIAHTTVLLQRVIQEYPALARKLDHLPEDVSGAVEAAFDEGHNTDLIALIRSLEDFSPVDPEAEELSVKIAKCFSV